MQGPEDVAALIVLHLPQHKKGHHVRNAGQERHMSETPGRNGLNGRNGSRVPKPLFANGRAGVRSQHLIIRVDEAVLALPHLSTR